MPGTPKYIDPSLGSFALRRIRCLRMTRGGGARFRQRPRPHSNVAKNATFRMGHPSVHGEEQRCYQQAQAGHGPAEVSGIPDLEHDILQFSSCRITAGADARPAASRADIMRAPLSFGVGMADCRTFP